MQSDDKTETLSKAEKERRELLARLAKSRQTLTTSSQKAEESGQVLSIVIDSTATFERR